MNSGLKFISANTLAVLAFVSIALLRGNVGQFTVLGILVAWAVYNLFVYFRPRWAMNRQESTKPTAKPAPRPQQYAPSVQSAPAVQVISTPASVQRMVVPEVPSNYKQVMLRHINFRITQKLQGAFPGATWSWGCNNPADIAAEGGVARIRTFGAGDFNFADVTFAQNGGIRLSMLQVFALDGAAKPAAAASAASSDPDSLNIAEWYDLSASCVIRATIDEVYTRGYQSLYIDESGEVYIKEGGQNVKQGKLSFMPGKKLWPDLVPCFADDDILATVGDDELALSWGQ